jgi:hypothetical protein
VYLGSSVDVTTEGHTSPRPVYQLHYLVFYNTTLSTSAGLLTQKVSNTCAELYARTFLENLLSLEAWLDELCEVEVSRRAGVEGWVHYPTVDVLVHPVVVVTVLGTTVS